MDLSVHSNSARFIQIILATFQKDLNVTSSFNLTIHIVLIAYHTVS